LGKQETSPTLNSTKLRSGRRKIKLILMKENAMTRKNTKKLKEIAIYLNNRPIPQVERLKYLGTIFDRKLTFKVHKLRHK
jgi:hypothetical protein